MCYLPAGATNGKDATAAGEAVKKRYSDRRLFPICELLSALFINYLIRDFF